MSLLPEQQARVNIDAEVLLADADLVSNTIAEMLEARRVTTAASTAREDSLKNVFRSALVIECSGAYAFAWIAHSSPE